MTNVIINPMRSFLFVPGNRADRFEKARISGADIYCIDLEDSVPKTGKAKARKNTIEYINMVAAKYKNDALLYIRINGLSTLEGIKDLLALAENAADGSLPDGIVLPMASSAIEVQQLLAVLGAPEGLVIMPLIESPLGIANLTEILNASPSVKCVGFGIADYTAITGSDMSWDSLLFARSRIIETASMHAVHCLDGPWFDTQNSEGLAVEVRSIAQLGFGGKMAIHPSQIEIIHRAIYPSESKIQWAKEIVKEWHKEEEGVLSINGIMIDKPLFQQAERILVRAERGLTN